MIRYNYTDNVLDDSTESRARARKLEGARTPLRAALKKYYTYSPVLPLFSINLSYYFVV